VLAAESALAREKLLFERRKLLERRQRSISSFDAALVELRVEKLKLAADLKTTDLRKLALFQELQLLKEFEKKDVSLAQKLETKHHEKSEIVGRVAECQDKLTQKKGEIERLLEKDKQIMQEFNSALGENNKFYDVLLRIFKKKIKRARKSNAEGGGDEEYNSDEDEDEGLDSDEELDGEEEEVCPPGCDPALYEKVCELREKRLEQEDVYADFQKGVELLKKENDTLVKKEKVIDKALRDTEADIQAFQTEKQRKLNELHVLVTLQLHQVEHLVDEKLPADLTSSLVISNAELRQLKARTRVIQDEKKELRRKQKSLRAEHAALLKDQAIKAERVREYEARAYDVQMLKFGQVIDLEALDSVGVNKNAEELRERIRELERKQDKVVHAWSSKLKHAKGDLKLATEQSTTRLNSVASLFERQQKLEASLNKNQQATISAREPQAERQERQKLVQLVKLQAKEVEALKLEINMLRRKGGHVYSTPSETSQ